MSKELRRGLLADDPAEQYRQCECCGDYYPADQIDDNLECEDCRRLPDEG